MKKIYGIAAVALAAFSLASCSEWEPVFANYDTPEPSSGMVLDVTHTIKELKAMYSGSPLKIDDDNMVIAGQVISSDQSGNFYRTMYIQDETGGIEIKMGLTGLYNEYKMGQWVYVKCEGLTLGSYGGMLQLGYSDPTGKYETAYLDVKYIISNHVFKGEEDDVPEPVELDEEGIKDEDNYGRLCRVNGLKYANKIFCILYGEDDDQKTYLSKGTYGVNTWAMSENGFKKYLAKDRFNGAVSSSDSLSYAKAASAVSVSQYFRKGSADLQVRTSGYSDFADIEIPEDVLTGTVDLVGILTYYNGNNQFVLIDDSDEYVIVE